MKASRAESQKISFLLVHATACACAVDLRLMAHSLLGANAVQASGAAAEEASGSSSLDTLESQIVGIRGLLGSFCAGRGAVVEARVMVEHGGA